MRAVSKICSRDFCIGRNMCHRCVYLLWLDLICTVSGILSIFSDLYAQVLGFHVFQWNFLSEVYGFGKFAMKWFSNPHLKHIFAFWPLHSVQLLLELRELKGDLLWLLSFIYFLNNYPVGRENPQWLHLDWQIFLSVYFLLNCTNSNNQFASQI